METKLTKIIFFPEFRFLELIAIIINFIFNIFKAIESHL